MENKIAKKIQVIIIGLCALFITISALRMMYDVATQIDGIVALLVFGMLLAFQGFLLYTLGWLWLQEFKESFGRQ